jgi:DNA-binding MltR family transcriptional regulator
MALKRTNPNRDVGLEATDVEFQRLLADSDDRTAVIVGSTLLDQRLSAYVRALAVPDDKLVDGILDSRRPYAVLGSFSSKIKVLRAFGMLSADEAADLDLIRDIRNDFAHNILQCSFTDPEVVAHTQKLTLGCKAVKNTETPPRIVFNVEIYLLYGTLGQRIRDAKPAAQPEDWDIR